MASFAALIATSEAPTWTLQAAEVREAPFRAGAPSRLTSEATVLYRTPKGRWPLKLYAEAVAHANWQSDRGTVTSRATIHDDFARVAEGSANEFTIVCKQKLCEGMITLDVAIAATSDTLRPYSQRLPDGGTMFSTLREVRVSASFDGGIEDDFFLYSCESDGSTDRETAPKTMGLELTFEPFEFDPSAPPLIDLEADAGSASDAAAPGDGGASEDASLLGMDARAEQ